MAPLSIYQEHEVEALQLYAQRVRQKALALDRIAQDIEAAAEEIRREFERCQKRK